VNTSTVALRVVGGNKKESLESVAVNYGCESHRTRTREAIINNRPVLSSERTPHINKSATCMTVIKSGCKPQMGALLQDRLTTD
jgi:hypothetical protein